MRESAIPKGKGKRFLVKKRQGLGVSEYGINTAKNNHCGDQTINIYGVCNGI